MTTQLHNYISAIMLSMTENDIQKIVDNNPDHERSLKSKHGIQNAIAAYKQLYQESVTSLTIENEIVYQSRWSLTPHLLPRL